MRPLRIVILAAGRGTRMKSALPKVLHPVAGRPMIGFVADAALQLDSERIVVVVGYEGEMVRDYLGDRFVYAVQEVQKGTGHALLAARPLVEDGEADLVVVCGDLPLVTSDILRDLVAGHRDRAAAATVLTAIVDDPTGYGRIVRDPSSGRIRRIVEDADASAEQLALREINTGLYCFRFPECLPYLDRLRPDNRQGEFYLVDLIPMLVEDGHPVAAFSAPVAEEVEGVNGRAQLARAEARIRARILDRLMATGVTVSDPGTTYVDWGVAVGADTVLEPGTILRGRVTVGARCVIGPYTEILDSDIGGDCRVTHSVVEGSRILPGARVGPFSHLRTGTVISEEARVGNFAEIKNSTVGPRTKIQHHSYIGDAEIGPEANIGAGTVVVNYDGAAKHRTSIGRAAFIGCNTNLVAPVSVGDGAYTAAGSTVTREVPPGNLAVSRSRQENIEGWVERRRPGTVSAEAARAARDGAKAAKAGEPRTKPEEGAG